MRAHNYTTKFGARFFGFFVLLLAKFLKTLFKFISKVEGETIEKWQLSALETEGKVGAAFQQ